MSHRSSSLAIVLVSLAFGLGAGWWLGRGGEGDRPPAAQSPAPAPGATEGVALPRAHALAGPSEEPEGGLRGKWRRARDAGSPVGESAGARAAELTAVPYLQGYRPASGAHGVTVDAPPAAPGLNLVLSAHGAEALLMANDGEVLHRWRSSLRRVWPEIPDHPNLHKLDYWRRAQVLPDGSLLAIFEINGLVKLDRESRLVWAYRSDVHHDLFVAPDETIWVLDRRGRVDPRLHREQPILEDLVTVLSPAGEVLRRISVLDAFLRSPYAPMVWSRPVASGDVFHTNTLTRLDGSLEGLHPAFAEGNLLISVLQLDTVAVLDPETERIVWAFRGMFRKQHQPELLASGHLLLFDNRGPGGERSRVLEIDPFAQRIVWSFGGDDDSLFSRTLGSCQRLPNGNTLIVESENGRALEVTPEGKIVWEYRNPHRAGDDGELVAALMDVVRLPPDFAFRGAD